jgi:hypothetical protein
MLASGRIVGDNFYLFEAALTERFYFNPAAKPKVSMVVLRELLAIA